MNWLRAWRRQPYWVETVALGGLLIAIAAAGLIGLGINNRVRAITNESLRYDVELEDRGDDFRVAVLDMRHFHRNITFAGPTRTGVADFEAAYRQMVIQIDRLEELGVTETAATPAQLREIAEQYYEEFRPMIDLYDSQRQDFFLASDDGLVRLAELESAALAVERLGEARAATAFRSVEAAENVARAVLLTVLGGLILVGVGFAYLIITNSREKQQVAAQLANSLRLKNEFIADASHELRTPLTVLRANAELALQLDASCVHTEFLEEILRESTRMTRLVEDLLFLARSDADQVPYEFETLDIHPFFIELGERAAVLAAKRDATLKTDLKATGLLHTDPARIEQLILILVDNAAKYSPPGKEIKFRSTTQDGLLRVEVADQGSGIPESELPFIFERFYRVDKARARKQGGSGLGLSIARRIVEKHGGRIEAESQLNEGTTMRFYIPLVSEADGLTANELQLPGKANASLPHRVRNS